MKKFLNTLYITNPDVYLGKEGESIVASVKGSKVMQIPLINVEGIICFNRMGVSPQLMHSCAQNNVGLSFLSPSGEFLARVSGPVNGNVLLRRKQYRIADDAMKCLSISQIMIAGKIHNSRKALERLKRDHPERGLQTDVQQASSHLNRLKLRCMTTRSLDELRGIEGEAANIYFSVFNRMILINDESFVFSGRNRRPPKDNVNCLLSLAYTLLTHEMRSALETVGLDPYVGFLHMDRPGRVSLALDMIEELRSYCCDRFVISLINKKQVKSNGFEVNGFNVIMKDETKRCFIDCWQNRKKEEIEHPYLKQKIPIGLIPYAQALLLSRYLRGDLDNYPVFILQ